MDTERTDDITLSRSSGRVLITAQNQLALQAEPPFTILNVDHFMKAGGKQINKASVGWRVAVGFAAMVGLLASGGCADSRGNLTPIGLLAVPIVVPFVAAVAVAAAAEPVATKLREERYWTPDGVYRGFPDE
jgi:hypothetical protein